MQTNPYTGEPDARLRASKAGVVVRLSAGEVESVIWAQDRGYLPDVGMMRHRDDDGPCSWRVRAADAYAWREWVDAGEESFGTCLAPRLLSRIMGAHVILTNRFAV